jgi:WD40 repeat protein
MMGLSFSPDDATLVAAVGVSQSMGAELRFWDVRSKLLRRQVCHGDYHVFAVAFAPDGESLVTGCQDGYARIWNASAGTEPEQALHHESAIMGLAYSPDGRQICTVGGWEMPVRLWTRPAE